MPQPLFSFQEVEKLLESILVNKTLCKVESLKGAVFVLFSHPSIEETIKSRFIRERALLEATEQGVPSRAELEERLQTTKLLTDAEKAKIADLENQIAAQHRVLQITKIQGRRQVIEENIERLQKEFNGIKAKSKTFLLMSAESKADEESLLYLGWASTNSIEGNKYWPNFEAFENERDLLFRNSVLENFIKFNAGIPVKTLRFLARHNLWRIRYAAALKVGGQLFPGGLGDLTPDQLGLLYWSNFYQSIYEMLPDDQPDAETIDDDEALDSYMESYFKRRDLERNEVRVKRASGNNKGKLSAWDRGEELIITASHPEYMKMQYSEQRVESGTGASDVEVISPTSRRARNRAEARRNRR